MEAPSTPTEVLGSSIFNEDQSQATTSTDPQLVQVPANLLNTLLASIKGLEEKVTRLQNNYSAVENKISSQQNSEAKFWRFPKLPAEIRGLIWKVALTEPQIHIWGERAVSRSRVNTVMQACREARDECLKLKLHFYHVNEYCHFNPKCIRNYINYDNDIIWIPDGDTFWPEHVKVYCNVGYSQGNSVLDLDEERWEIQECRSLGHGHRPRGLAVSHSKWKDPKDEQPGYWAGSMEALWWYGGIPELYIVVNGDATNDRDIVFVEPTDLVQRVLPEVVAPTDGAALSWKIMEERKVKTMEEFKAKRTRARWEEMEGTMVYFSAECVPS